MTKTRRQAALDSQQAANPQPSRSSNEVSAPNHKISKAPKLSDTVAKSSQSKIKTPTNKSSKSGKGRGSSSKEELKKEIVYSDMVNLNIIKPFDISAVLD